VPDIDIHSPEYKRHIASANWKKTRDQKLAEAHYRCEKCGISKWSKPLEVHHLTYDRLGRERLSDLQVLCAECHEKLHVSAEEGKMGDWSILAKRRPAWGNDIHGAFDDFMCSRYGVLWSVRLTNDRINYLFEKFRELPTK